jgi:hypothetical protein
MAWADDRDGSAGYVTVTTLATAVDEAVPFAVVYLSDLPADFHTAMSDASDTDGKTIRVSNSDGTTQLACVPIGVNTSTDTGCLIFLGTGMSASVDVDYRIYVGNASLSMPSASGGMGEQAVFASYAGVYFPGVDTRDWTSGGRTLTAVNSPGTAASGFEGITAATYNGTSQYHHYDNATQAVTAFPITLEALAYASDASNARTVAGMYNSSGFTEYNAIQEIQSSGNVYFRLQNGSATTTGTPAAPAAWKYITGNRDTATTGTSRIYVDGAADGTSTTNATAMSVNRFTIAVAGYSSIQRYFPGNVAVALLSDSARSADYVATMQDNWAGTMYTAGAWTANDSDVVAGSTGWVLFQTIGQSTSAAADWTNTADALVDDANTAECTLDDTGVFESEYLNFTNPAYGTTIPTGAPSYTIEFRIKRMSDTASAREVQDLTVQFIDDTGTRVGDNEADTITDWPSALGTVDYIVSGLTPDGTEFTSAAGMALRATGVNTNGATLTEVATAWMRVSWTGTDAAYNTRGFFALTE